LTDRGYTSFTAPSMPGSIDVMGYANGSYRALWQYILPWLPSRWADKFVVRVDTLAEQPPTGGAS
jgi:hypothetical protein